MTIIEMEMIRPHEEFGPALAGRPRAAQLRDRIVAAAAHSDVVVDLDGFMLSPSAADELFGKFPPELTRSGRVRFENVDENLAVLVEFVSGARAPRVAAAALPVREPRR